MIKHALGCLISLGLAFGFIPLKGLSKPSEDGCDPRREACRCYGSAWCREIGGPLPLKPWRCQLKRSKEKDGGCDELESAILSDCAAQARASTGVGMWSCSPTSKSGQRTLYCTSFAR